MALNKSTKTGRLDTRQFEQRKSDHITQSLNINNEATGQSGVDRIHLIHEALPDLDFHELDIGSKFLKKKLQTPFFVSGMTAGHADAAKINDTLAEACEIRGWVMGVGSQRRDLEAGIQDRMDDWRQFRKKFPKLTLVGNLGISQVIRASISDIQRVVDSLQADVLAIHLNAHQEAIQPEGTPDFKGSFKAIQRICAQLKRPVMLKETGCGFSERTLKRLRGLPLVAVDISGLGGTHWGRIEGARADSNSVQARAALSFASWGESTVDSVLAAEKVLPSKIQIWASGGVRSGLDAAKLIALGAHRVGYAKPALEAALKGESELHRWMEQQEFELKVALFGTGCSNTQELRKNKQVEFKKRTV